MEQISRVNPLLKKEGLATSVDVEIDEQVAARV